MNANGHSTAITAEATTPTSVVVAAGDSFVVTPHVRRLAERALSYLKAGYPVHFSGPAGTGKTTLAMHVAALRGRPVTLIHGDNEFDSSDLVGGHFGYKKSKLIDNFIHSVVKTEETMSTLWADNRLTFACKAGDTLVYDEFTRSRPEANNALLAVLAEGLITLAKRQPQGEGYLDVHPEFRAIFTSNPEEYAGVHRTQDALMDRLITITVDYFDRETEVQITQAKSGMAREQVEVIVDIVRELRGLGVAKQGPSLRACIMISRVTAQQGARARWGDSSFVDVCKDVLGGTSPKVVRKGSKGPHAAVEDVIVKHLKVAVHRSEQNGTRGQSASPVVEKGA